MGKKKIYDAKPIIITYIFVILFLLLLGTNKVKPAIMDLELNLNNIEEKANINNLKRDLESTEFISHVDIIDKQDLNIALKPNRKLRHDRVKKILSKNDFEITKSKITVIGKMAREGFVDIVFKSEGDETIFILHDENNKGGDDFFEFGELFLEGEFKDLALESLKEGTPLYIRGSLFRNKLDHILVEEMCLLYSQHCDEL